MRIVLSNTYDNMTQAISQAAESLVDAQRQVSTGLRVGRISDDPLSAAIDVSEHATLDRLDAYKGASDAASYRIGLADNVLSDVINQLTSAQSLTMSARGSDKTPEQRTAVAN